MISLLIRIVVGVSSLSQVTAPAEAPEKVVFEKTLPGGNRVELRESRGEGQIKNQDRVMNVPEWRFLLVLKDSRGTEQEIWARRFQPLWQQLTEALRVEFLDVLVEGDAVAVLYNQEGTCWAYIQRKTEQGESYEPKYSDWRPVPWAKRPFLTLLPLVGQAMKAGAFEGTLGDLRLSVVDAAGQTHKYVLQRLPDGTSDWVIQAAASTTRVTTTPGR